MAEEGISDRAEPSLRPSCADFSCIFWGDTDRLSFSSIAGRMEVAEKDDLDTPESDEALRGFLSYRGAGPISKCGMVSGCSGKYQNLGLSSPVAVFSLPPRNRAGHVFLHAFNIEYGPCFASIQNPFRPLHPFLFSAPSSRSCRLRRLSLSIRFACRSQLKWKREPNPRFRTYQLESSIT